MIRSIEVEVVDTGFAEREIEVTAGRIGFVSACLVPKRDEKAIAFGEECRQTVFISVQDEFEVAEVAHLANLTGRCRNVENRLFIQEIELGWDAVREVRFVIPEGDHP